MLAHFVFFVSLRKKHDKEVDDEAGKTPNGYVVNILISDWELQQPCLQDCASKATWNWVRTRFERKQEAEKEAKN